MIPITRSEWLKRKETREKMKLPFLCEEEVIRKNVEWLIERLYSPNEECGAVIEKEFLEKFGLDKLSNEAINWGSLGVTFIEKHGDRFIVNIEEVSPSAVCFIKYIKYWLKKWGWNVEVKTEW